MASEALLCDIKKFTLKYCGGRDHVEAFLTELRLIIERSVTEATDYMINRPDLMKKETTH